MERELTPRSLEKIRALVAAGVVCPHPLSLDIGEEVDTGRIAPGVVLYPGCRIYGAGTVIAEDCRLGHEGPVTVEDCRLGPGVELKGGFFRRSVFLAKASLGMGAHVREGCLLEEEAGGAHCVGLKQTILFPFVTLGSLVNLCDCLVAGGTSRRDHSEVGSSYIHFNFTPDADKATPSLVGDVPRGVMLNRPPVFLGGQGGMVGPVRLGFGNVVAAGSIIRRDYPEDGQLIYEAPPASRVREYRPASYPSFRRIVENNIVYLANLAALAEWYAHVRRPFFAALTFGDLIYEGVVELLAAAKEERLKRLAAMADKAAQGAGEGPRRAFREGQGFINRLFTEGAPEVLRAVEPLREAFLGGLERSIGGGKGDYLATIRSLPPAVSSRGTAWLGAVVTAFCRRVAAGMPDLGLFGDLPPSGER